jgi:two-component system sensor histidine kinase and response regulator WspE
MPGGGESCDPSMMELFRAELDSHLPVLGEGLLALEKDPEQPKLLEAMMRSAHSIKGAARIVGVEPAVRVSHVMEDAFVAAQKGEIRLGPGAVDVLLRGFDFLTQLAQAPQESASEKVVAELVETIALVRTGRVPPDRRPPVQQAVRPPQEEKVLRPENLDREGSARLWREARERCERGAGHYRFDFSSVREVHPMGLALLASLARTPRADGSPLKLEIVRATPDVHRLFRLTGLGASYTLQPQQEG